ncbi:MAG: hypothetical protein ABIV25_15640 [Paracoccaceae bacterium]
MTPRIALLAVALFATPSLAETTYRDDRSTPSAVVQSLYNAIDRHELARAYSYWDGSAEVPDFSTFAKGYKTTDHVELVLGMVTSDGAAGSVFYNVPVAIRATDTSGATHEFAGCYVLRLVNPALQEVPPFRPTHIVSGHLKPARGPLNAALPKECAG